MGLPEHQPAWIGIDVGTQSVRAALVGADGTLLGSGSAPLRSSRPRAGHHEQNPEDWWGGLGLATRAALAGAGGFALGGVAICSTSGSVLLSDGDGRPRTAALMYDDTRALAQAARVRDAELVSAGGHAQRGHPTSAVARLLWLLEHTAAGRPGGVRLTHCADLLAGRLTGGVVATDESHALKSGFDPELRRWRTELFDAVGVPASVLPDVVAPGSLLGRVSPAAARHTGLAAGTPVLAGMTDSCAGQIAAGALAPGSWSSVLGTTLALKGVCPSPIVDAAAGVYSHRHPDGAGWLAGGASNVGAGELTRRFPGRDLSALDAAAACHEPAPAVLYPLGEPGERFPFARPDARPIVLGRLGDEAEEYAAVLQGIGFVERLCLDRMRTLGAAVDGPLRLTGGGARSDYWCQLRADILGRSVRRPVRPEPAVGMAILASAGSGSVTDAAARMVRADLELDPRADRVGRFDDAYGRLRDELAARGYVVVEQGTSEERCSEDV
ncbi:MAG TPA: FGGY family carbohydrate kinase [Solirubrobacteraceae bacterium]